MRRRKLEFAVGDKVRFDRFGEWLDGVVILVRDDLICIEYGTHKATTWRYPYWHAVHHAQA